MVWEVGCLLCCWGEWRGFAQLREGSDGPPPPVSMGASAWADATPRPASRPSRTVIIASVRCRRVTRCMKPNPFTNTKRYQHRLPIQSSSCRKAAHSSTPACAANCTSHDKSRSSSRRPPLFTLPPSPSTTHEPGHSPTTMDLLVEEKRLFPAITRNWKHGRRPS